MGMFNVGFCFCNVIVLPVAIKAVCCFHFMLEIRVKSWFGDVIVCYLSILLVILLKFGTSCLYLLMCLVTLCMSPFLVSLALTLIGLSVIRDRSISKSYQLVICKYTPFESSSYAFPFGHCVKEGTTYSNWQFML